MMIEQPLMNVDFSQAIGFFALQIKFDMFKSVIVLAFFGLALSVLQVYSPACAVFRIGGSIEYTLSNFGEIPYGQTIIGQIILPNDPQLCKTKGEINIMSKDSATKNILLVRRGGCKFTEKVINAQNLGADLIIIYDHSEGDRPSVIMKNDGHGHLAEIPSLFISKSDGVKLQSTDKDCSSLPIVKIVFQIDQAKTSSVTLWLDAANRQTYILARDFHKNDYFDAIKDRIDLKIRFRVENTCEEWICGKDDCMESKSQKQKYCRNIEKPPNPDIPYTKGADLIAEQLREYFLWEQLKNTDKKEEWWYYMAKFDHQVCLQQADVEDCSYTTMKGAQISNAIIDNVKRQIEQVKNTLAENKRSILNETFEESREMGIYFYPEVTINNRNFYGLFKAPEVFEAICNSLIDPPGKCVKFIKQNHEIDTNDESEGLWKTILVILLLMTIGFLLALFVYTKIIKRQVNQQLSVEVNKMVESYCSTAGKKSGSNLNSYNKFDA